ncbi:DUF222 domain-containing protein [Kribbella sp. NPDC050241]|uniref:DUF222 domain-containing protein n=1 Tax=Kribbella sp. NPDC050241 TaxID=3364115 RepID=UPI0037953F08
MEILGERPVWSMSDSEKLSTLDAVVAEVARLETIKWQLIAGLDQSGYAKDLGAGDTARLLSQRYRIDATEAHRDVRVASRLTRHPATTAALPDPGVPFANLTTAHPAASETEALSDPDGSTAGAWRVHPAQAEAIMSVMARVPSTVPAEDVEFAERQLIGLAATHTPSELRRAGKKIRDILVPWCSGTTCRPEPSAAWPAMPRSSRSCSAPSRSPSTSAPANASSPDRCGAR